MKYLYLITSMIGLVGVCGNVMASREAESFPKNQKTVTRADDRDTSLDVYADKLSYGEKDSQATLEIVKGKDIEVVYYRVVNDRGENEIDITRETGNEIIVPLKTHGAYTVIAAGFDKYEDLANPLEYTECYFYYEPDDNSNWIPLGKGMMTDDFVASIFSDLDNLSFPVEIERNKLREGQIRVVNPYGAPYVKALREAAVPESAFKADLENNHYLYFDISDPDFVYMSEGCTGLKLLNHDVLLIGSFGKYFLDQGKSKNEIKFAQYNGLLNDNTITFYQYGLYTMWNPDFEISSANMNQAFSLTIPDLSGIEDLSEDDSSQIKYFNLQGMPLPGPLAGSPCIQVTGKKSSVIFCK